MVTRGCRTCGALERVSAGTGTCLSLSRKIWEQRDQDDTMMKMSLGRRQDPSFQADFIGSGIKQQMNCPWGDSLGQTMSDKPVPVSSLTFLGPPHF